MKHRITTHQHLAVAGMALAFTITAPAWAASESLLYVKPPETAAAVLAPSGQRLALIVSNPQSRQALSVMDVPLNRPPRILQSYAEANVLQASWINDQRLVVRVAVTGPEVPLDGVALIAIDQDGGNERLLTSWRAWTHIPGTHMKSRVLTYGWDLLSTVEDGSADILVKERGGQDKQRLGRLDTLTGELRRLGDDVTFRAVQWVFDRAGDMPALRVRQQGRDRIVVKDSEASEWRTVWERPTADPDMPSPLALENGHELLVATRSGGDTEGLFVLDTRNGRLDPEPVLRVARYDVGPALVD
ncbi:hypothetical protein CLD22_26860, partial [Rubrivivax gelatinosus]|nr:hypothetical protein [Rubrivivax gelatinosus]